MTDRNPNMVHADVLKKLGTSHAKRAWRIGHGCKEHQVRDWIRRGQIAPGWILHVAAASGVDALDLLQAVTVYDDSDPRSPELAG